MAEGGGLLNRYTVNSRIVGSNPIPSASLLLPNFSASRYSSDVEARYLLYRPNTPSWRNFGAEAVAVSAPGNDPDFSTAQAGSDHPLPTACIQPLDRSAI